MSCVFCRIVAAELPAHIVYEDDQVMAIMDAGHVNPGHTLVLAKTHVETLEDAGEDLAAHAFRIANRIAKAMQQAHPAEGSTVLQANRPAGFQTVPHFHLHVLPRHTDDGVDLEWPVKNPPQDVLAANAQALRKVLKERGGTNS
ncbi:MAG: HIT family protein [Sulfitobacter sp.]|nr:HIT family protein [Sulfitobacter sp.]